MLRYLVLSMVVLLTQSALGWEELSNKKNSGCEKPPYCRINQSKTSYEIRIFTSVKRNLKTADSIEIKKLSDGSAIKFNPEAMNNIPQEENFKVIKWKANPDSKNFDIAIHAFNSAREGEVFYYFIYDETKDQFIVPSDTFPKMTFDRKTKEYSSELQDTKFRLNKELHFEAVETKE